MAEDINANLADAGKSFQERIDEVRSVAEENLRYTKTLFEEYQAKNNLVRGSAQELLAQNIDLSQKIYQLTVKIKRQLFWQQIFGVVKTLIIVVPLVIGAIYLYPLLANAAAVYQQLADIKLPADSADLLKQLGAQLKK